MNLLKNERRIDKCNKYKNKSEAISIIEKKNNNCTNNDKNNDKHPKNINCDSKKSILKNDDEKVIV